MMPGEHPLTDDQLAIAWRHLARPGWPPTLQETMLDPLRAACVRGLARSLSRGGINAGPSYTPPTPQHAPPVPPTPTSPPVREKGRWAHHTPKAGAFDARKAAANDRDD